MEMVEKTDLRGGAKEACIKGKIWPALDETMMRGRSREQVRGSF